jgi:beta-glucosidase-like glycosyl hydrolase
VRDVDFVTAFPTALSAAMTWNRTLIRTRGVFMGREHKGKGVNVALGPMMNMGCVLFILFQSHGEVADT